MVAVGGGDALAVPHLGAVHPRLVHAALERVSLEGGPAALGHHVVLVDRPRVVRLNHHQVGLHAWANEAPVGHAEEARHPMGHQVHDLFHGEQPVVHQVEHGHKGVLDERPT